MATKRYNQQNFTANVNGKSYEFYCWTTSTRNGFCHSAEIYCQSYIGCVKQSWINRTWERFTYETALRRAIEKCPKEDREELTAILIERKAQKEHEEAEAFLNSFKAMHDRLTPENKELLAKTVGTIHNEAEARAALTVDTLMTLTQ